MLSSTTACHDYTLATKRTEENRTSSYKLPTDEATVDLKLGKHYKHRNCNHYSLVNPTWVATQSKPDFLKALTTWRNEIYRYAKNYGTVGYTQKTGSPT
eukprot:5270192-Amphidinium_carterae.1